MVESNDIILWAVAFVALWWVIDWFHMRQEGERLPLRRAPLRVLADVLPKLWRNKTFMLALLCLWLIGAAITGLRDYLYRLGADPTLDIPGPRITGPLSLTGTVPETLALELPEALPRLVEVPLGTWAALLFAVLLVAAMVRIIIDPPDRLGEETARRLKWPAGLVVAYTVLGVAAVAVPREFIEGLGLGGDARSMGGILFAIGAFVVMPILPAPVWALLWRLVLEIARDGVWSFVSSMRAVAQCWLPIALLVLIANALRPMGVLAGGAYEAGWDYAYLAVLVLLFLTPWAILDRQEGLLAALRQSWRLFRQKPVDVIAFGLRFTLLFAVLGGLVALVEPRAAVEWAAWYAPLLRLARNALLLLQVLMLARLYVHLEEMLAEDEACASCPSARMAERLEEHADEEE
ncbi:MAG: hypothetical protein ACOCX2_10830 [Armatimonadota bacterium]